jgi:hypothetical protein
MNSRRLLVVQTGQLIKWSFLLFDRTSSESQSYTSSSQRYIRTVLRRQDTIHSRVGQTKNLFIESTKPAATPASHRSATAADDERLYSWCWFLSFPSLLSQAIIRTRFKSGCKRRTELYTDKQLYFISVINGHFGDLIIFFYLVRQFIKVGRTAVNNESVSQPSFSPPLFEYNRSFRNL